MATTQCRIEGGAHAVFCCNTTSAAHESCLFSCSQTSEVYCSPVDNTTVSIFHPRDVTIFVYSVLT